MGNRVGWHEGQKDEGTKQENEERIRISTEAEEIREPAALRLTSPVDPGQTRLFRQEGEYWTISYQGAVCRLKDMRGLRYLAYLLRHPHRQIHVLDLVVSVAGSLEDSRDTPGEHKKIGFDNLQGAVSRLGDAGELLDAQAKATYKRRLEELREQLEEAEAFNNEGWKARIEEERDFLLKEIARAVGLGGRDRRAASPVERARVNVTRAIKTVLQRLSVPHPLLAEYLKNTIHTGICCSYTPDVRVPSPWQF